ncbi:MAG: stage V sporulation protein D [Clostridiaceae bacterium]
MAKKTYIDRATIKRRMFMVLCILFVLFFLLACRLTYLMVFQSERYKSIANEQWTSQVKIDAKRGKILDRNGNELALSANVYRVDLDMNTLRTTMSNKKLTQDQVAEKLSKALDMDVKDVNTVLNKKLKSGLPLATAILARRIEKENADKVRALNLLGVNISEDTKRYYPNGNFLSQVIGHTNSDGIGLTGVELKYDSYLKGKAGELISETDQKSQYLPYTISKYTKPENGKDVVLTIDDMIQHFAEKAALDAMKVNKAKAVSIIVMDPNTGEILAMANTPGYDLNNPWKDGASYDELQATWRNRAVSDTFEPGSIFKVITASAAMSEKVVNENSTFNCTGSLKVGGRTIRCWKTSGHGQQSFLDILKNSCNVGFMKVGAALGRERLNKYIYSFGLGKKTGVDLPGEASGIVKSTNSITESDLATISFGQTDTVSCIQYLTAFNAVANGGTLITPHVMKKVVGYDDNDNENYKLEYNNYNKRKVLDSEVAKTLRGYLEQVVSKGGGAKAFVDGYHIAGKTGTAQKISGKGTYASGKYIASFVGMAPADNPKVTVMISIDEPDPSNYYAGQIAAPVAKQIFYDIFNYYSINSDASQQDTKNSLLKDIMIPEVRGLLVENAKKLLRENHLDFQIEGTGKYITKIVPAPGMYVKEGTKLLLYSDNNDNYNKVVVVPNFVGMTKEKAEGVLSNLGLKGNFTGSGMVTEQSISEGEEVNKGTAIKLNLEVLGD